jgi:hypothetical protein
MAQILISHSTIDAACVRELRDGLVAAGYEVWEPPEGVDLGDPGQASELRAGLIGSAAHVLVWSAAAAGEQVIPRALALGQRLMVPLLVVRLDEAPLPPAVPEDAPTVQVGANSGAGADCAAVAQALLPHLNDIVAENPLVPLLSRLSHEYIKVRRQAVHQVAGLLADEKLRERALALLEEMRERDLFDTLRHEAEEVLIEAAELSAGEGPSHHRFPVHCAQGHVTYYDRRSVCARSRPVTLEPLQKLDTFSLRCTYPGCTEETEVVVDCEGYR